MQNNIFLLIYNKYDAYHVAMKDTSIKRSSTLFLQAVIVLLGIGALAFLLWEPNIEGRNIGATLFEVYFKDPFLAYAYAASTLFFLALYKAFMLLRYIANNEVFTSQSVHALRTIKWCALLLCSSIVLVMLYLFLVVRGTDDIAGGVAMGLMMSFASCIVATAAAVFEKLLQNVVEMKSENDLTI